MALTECNINFGSAYRKQFLITKEFTEWID
jgi:hypothetical protein